MVAVCGDMRATNPANNVSGRAVEMEQSSRGHVDPLLIDRGLGSPGSGKPTEGVEIGVSIASEEARNGGGRWGGDAQS